MNAPALRIAPSIHVLERGWLSSNNVLLFGRDEVAMIDSGYVAHAEQTQTLVRHVLHQRGRERLDVLLNTHLHSDHTLGYPDVMLTPWVVGRLLPLEVYGPLGTAAMTETVP